MKLSEILQRAPIELDGLRQARDEWQSNPRLRLGLLTVWVLLLLYGALVLSDLATAMHADLLDVQKRRDRLEAINAQQYWLERADRSEAALAELEQTFPVVASSGRAEAEVRSMLEKAIADVDTRKLRLSMLPAEQVKDGELWQVVGTIMGVVDGGTARDFVANLEIQVNHARFRRLKLVRGLSAEKVRVEVEMEFLYRATGG